MELSAIQKAIDKYIIRPIAAIGVLVLIGFMLLTVADVLARYIFNHPILGTMELIKTCMVVLSFLVLGWTTHEKGHVKLDFIIARFSSRKQHIAETLYTIGALFFTTFMTYSFIKETIYRFDIMEKTPSLSIPVFLVYAIADMGLVITCLVLVVQFVVLLAKRVEGRDES